LNAPPRLSLSGVRKAFGALPVLGDLSLFVGAGEFVSILGPSGSGKSTTFKLLTGALRPDGGDIAVDGRPISTVSSSAAAAPFAFMPQRDALLPWRRIIDNVTLGLEIQGVPRRAARARVAPLFAEFGLAGFERHYPAQLSGGMRQRAALLRTVVQNRGILLLDEPFGALDALTRAALQRWLERMWERHRWTILLITHDVREAVFLSDRVYVLSERPARVIREVAIPLPRPRTQSDLAQEAVARLEAELLETLIGQDAEAGQ
jgi:ABC-type nitrate/sulfonate/bicarbonate transport system ATPase subunit